MAAAELARRSKDSRVRPLLERLSKHASPRIREAAIDGLALVGRRQDLNGLLRVREGLDWGALRALCAALSALAEPADSSLLIELLEHPDDAVAASAALGLARLELRNATAALAVVASDEDRVAASANARLALSVLDGGPPVAGDAWTAIQLLGPAGEPIVRRQVSFSLENGATVYSYTGSSGVARLVGVVGGSVVARPQLLGESADPG